jgi:hypothetical protein
VQECFLNLTVVIPVFDDWAALALCLQELNAAFQSSPVELSPIQVSVLVVDDGSTTCRGPGFSRQDLTALARLEILHLRRNMGHQRALAAGLVYVRQNIACSALVVMDGDGEDCPAHIPALLREYQAAGGREMVFAARTKRLESPLFRAGYQTFRLLHLLLVGIPVRIGNFSVVSRDALERLVVSTELWNHYAAAVVRSRLPFRTVPLPRGKRLSGTSKMNAAALLVHGLSALSVFGDVVGARLLAASAAGLAAACLAAVAAVLIRNVTHLAIPGWAAYAAGIAAVLGVQFVILSFILILSILASRSHMTFLPIRDCPYFFGSVERVFPDE